jgi:hypothetical protein
MAENTKIQYVSHSANAWRGCPKCEKNGGYILRRGSGRCTTAHEYLFLFVKKIPYFWDMENCREACSENTHSKGTNKHHKNGQEGRERTNASFQDAIADPVSTRIPRSVWTLSSEANKYAHFATYPSELVRRMLAPLSPKGCCPVCGAQWAPVVESERVATRPGKGEKTWKHAQADALTRRSDASPNLDPQRHLVQTRVLEYRPTCNCRFYRLRNDVPEAIMDELRQLGLLENNHGNVDV